MKRNGNAISKIEDPLVRQRAQKFSKRTQLAFLSDDKIGRSWFFRLITILRYYVFIFVHSFEIIGIEKLPKGKGALMISRHTTHCADVLPILISGYHMTGRVTRGLLHRLLMRCFPFLRRIGCLPGERETAEALLEVGYLCGVIPGGVDEAMIGHKNAYKVCWPKKRKGFALIAMKAGCPIIPCFLQNQEEMRFNPIFWFGNLLHIGRLYSYIMLFNIPYIMPLVCNICQTLWFCCTWFQFPIPVKLTLHIGDPVEYGENDTAKDVVNRSRIALQTLINKHQPHGKSYSRALKQRIDISITFWKNVFSTIEMNMTKSNVQ